IAGDILAAREWDAQKVVATSVVEIGNWGNGDSDKQKVYTDIVDDQVDVTGRAFLGLTLACARCHDHKFDPTPTRDYHSLARSFFLRHIGPSPGVKTAGSPVLKIPLEDEKSREEKKRIDGQIAELEKRIE